MDIPMQSCIFKPSIGDTIAFSLRIPQVLQGRFSSLQELLELTNGTITIAPEIVKTRRTFIPSQQYDCRLLYSAIADRQRSPFLSRVGSFSCVEIYGRLSSFQHGCEEVRKVARESLSKTASQRGEYIEQHLDRGVNILE